MGIKIACFIAIWNHKEESDRKYYAFKNTIKDKNRLFPAMYSPMLYFVEVFLLITLTVVLFAYSEAFPYVRSTSYLKAQASKLNSVVRIYVLVKKLQFYVSFI